MAFKMIVTLLLHFWMLPGCSFFHGCPVNCTCDAEQMRCKNNIPRTTPNYVNEVLLSFSNSIPLSSGIFCDVSWKNVSKLSVDYSGSAAFYLGNYVFMGLKQIQVLKLHTEKRFQAYSNSLYGLENVTVLDLSGCTRLGTKDLITLFSIKTNIANLKKLFLSKVGREHEGIELSQSLVDVLANKDIHEIDLSNTPIFTDNPNMDGICDSLKKMNLSSSEINRMSHFDLYRTCMSLRSLDLNAMTLPKAKPDNVSCINDDFSIGELLPFLQYLNMLNFSRIDAEIHYFYFMNCSVTGLPLRFNWKEFHFSGYNLPILNVKIEENFFDQLQYLVLSNNGIETISSETFKNFSSLVKIDLSNNKLSQTKFFNETFSILFETNYHLEEIDLNENGLRYLPLTTFSSNFYLKRLDISNNMFKQITFNASRLINLNIFDMRNNSVESLDEFSRWNLDSLLQMRTSRENYTKQNSTSTLLIDLRENPFSCKCDSLQFIKWFVASPIFTTTRQHYHCQADGKEIQMDDKAIAAAEEDCERPIRELRKILLSSLIPTIVIILLVLIIFNALKRYRKGKFYQRLEDQVDLLHYDKIGFRFPVFVSYASDDSEFVITNVLNPLKVRDY